MLFKQPQARTHDLADRAVAPAFNLLSIVFFSLVFGVFAARLRATEKSAVMTVARAVFEVMLQMARLVLRFAPLGVFCLLLSTLMEHGLSALAHLGWHVTTVLGAGARADGLFHGFVKGCVASESRTLEMQSFTYEGAKFDLQGRGFLGFAYRSWVDSRDNTVQRRSKPAVKQKRVARTVRKSKG